MMYCCAGCFDDIHLSEHINKIAVRKGDCSYCGATTVSVITPDQLRDDFQAVAAAYLESQSEEARTLLDWFRVDWQMFSALDDNSASRLLCDILDDAGYEDRALTPVLSTNESPVMKWSEFRAELLTQNRFFFRQNLDLKSLEVFLNRLEVPAQEIGTPLFRARVWSSGKEFQVAELGMPPPFLAKSGRANPIGIPYLYAASTPETAIAEVRPHPGDRVSVVSLRMGSAARLVDLRFPRRTVSPFMTLAEEEIPEFRHQMEFFTHLEEELSRPVLPREADLEYLPTQYLCEFIKNCGYDGLVFRSSLSDGVNVTLFNESHVEYLEKSVYEVTRLTYSQRRFN
ncbi:MAG TPA: hypothetical protein DEG76_13880 [Pseudohongiella sp.]|nr:hypothetical protein [Pseudohongiella sp.]HBX38304.1 hypothetical protein [Pseudohongiella sp.]|tara:strand:- start:449 stop:1474 length:1026 start_codon:yes stop_codon:yes gene_type:complete